jgi:hypothetical protein
MDNIDHRKLIRQVMAELKIQDHGFDEVQEAIYAQFEYLRWFIENHTKPQLARIWVEGRAPGIQIPKIGKFLVKAGVLLYHTRMKENGVRETPHETRMRVGPKYGKEVPMTERLRREYLIDETGDGDGV